MVDSDLRYVVAGGDGLAAAGLTPDDFAGRRVQDMVPSDMLAQCLADYNLVLSKQSFTREHAVGTRFYQSYGKPFPHPGGKGDYALVVSYDITDRVRAEAGVTLNGLVRYTIGPGLSGLAVAWV